MAKPKLPQMPAEVPQFVIDKAELLLKAVGPLGHPRAFRQDLIGALIEAATPEQAARALTAYNPKLGHVIAELEASGAATVPTDGQTLEQASE